MRSTAYSGYPFFCACSSNSARICSAFLITISSKVLATAARMVESLMPTTAALAAVRVSCSVVNSGAIAAALVMCGDGLSTFLVGWVEFVDPLLGS
jgi:hypothetical protein